MSPKKRVVALKRLSLAVVASRLIFALSDDEGLHYETVEKYLSDATALVLQDTLEYILDNENLDAATRFSCLQVLLKKNVQVLETGIFPHSYYERILQVIVENGSGLQQLNLKGVWIHDRPELLTELLEKLTNLKMLAIPHIAGDFVLQSSARNRLSLLDIGGDCAFSAEALSEFKSGSIKILDIGSFGKRSLCLPEDDSCTVLTNVLQNLPNLTILRTYSFIGNSLLEIYKKNPRFETELIYVHDTETTVDVCEAIVALCPNLKSIYLDTPRENVLNVLSCLKSIGSLKLARFGSNDLEEYLRRSGRQLHTLKLCNCKEDRINLSAICSLSPELAHLDCYKLNLSLTQPDCYFMCLQSLDILYCNVDDSVVRSLLANCPFLKRVVVGDVLRLTDGDLFRLCAECEFLFLEELWLSCARCLTLTSVLLLMSHCPKLKSLGQINGWDVSFDDVYYMRSLISSTNTDLVLLPATFP